MTQREMEIRENIARVRAELDRATGRPGGVEICAVSKTVDAQTVNYAYDAGIRVLGENRVQEAMHKFPALNPGYSMNIIGQLQTNKVKYIMPFVTLVQSLDRMVLAEEIDRRAQGVGRTMDVLVQVNIAREPQKSGLDETELEGFLEKAARLPGIRIRGLMAIMPLVSDPEQVRGYFRAMRGWFDRLKERSIDKVEMDILSMGMSHDYRVAAEEGATMVRVGSAIFGRRQ